MIDSVQEQRARKQQYLRMQIIDKDYDAQEFTDYCLDTKGNVDIDQWSFGDLVELVSKFVSSKKLAEQSFEPFSSGSDFGGAFEKSPDNKQAVQQFSSLAGHVPPANNSAFNFEFVPETKPANLNSLDLDFLSTTFLGVPPQKPIPQPVSTMQNTINNLSKLEGQWKGPKEQRAVPPQETATIKLPFNVAEKLVNAPNMGPQTKTIVSTQQPVIVPVQSKPVAPFVVASVASAASVAAVANEVPSPSNKISVPSSKRVDDLFDRIPCRKVITRSLLINSRAEMNITGHEVVTTNMFVPDHVVYHLTTHPINIEVKRRFKDFEALRNILRKMFPLSKLPHLEKNSRLSETQPQVIKKQKYFLECFINDLLISSEYQNCRVIEQFLTLKDLDHLKKKFKEYDKLEKIKSLEQLTTSTGELELKFTEKHLDYNDRVENFVQISQAHYQKVRQLYDQLVVNIQACAKTLIDLTEVFTSLEKTTRDFNGAATFNMFPDLERCYKYIAEINSEWSTQLKTQARLIETDIKPRFKFEKENMGTIRQLLKARASMTETYLKRIERQKGTADKYTSSKLEDFKQGVDAPSKNLTVLTYQNAYINQKTSFETERMFSQLSMKLKTEFSRFSKLQSNICGDMRELWLGFSR